MKTISIGLTEANVLAAAINHINAPQGKAKAQAENVEIFRGDFQKECLRSAQNAMSVDDRAIARDLLARLEAQPEASLAYRKDRPNNPARNQFESAVNMILAAAELKIHGEITEDDEAVLLAEFKRCWDRLGGQA